MTDGRILFSNSLSEGLKPCLSLLRLRLDMCKYADWAGTNIPDICSAKKEKFMDIPGNSRKMETAYLEKAISYEAYIALIDELVAGRRTTGPDQSEAFIHYTQLNQQRMHRWEKTIQLLPSAESAIRSIAAPQTWLVLTEAWCGEDRKSV